jgi:hypothetical protein
MSDSDAKEKRSKRIHKEEVAIKKQVKIAKQHGLTNSDRAVKEPHRLAKHHAMDCGNPDCFLCGNPRHLEKHGETKQEKSFIQTEKWND